MVLTEKKKRDITTFKYLVLFLAPAVICLLLFQYVPLFTAIKSSFYKINTILPKMKTFVGFANYVKMIDDPKFLLSISRTFLWTAVVLVVQLPLGMMLALLLKKSGIIVGIVRSAAFAPVVASLTVVAVIWNLMYHPENGLFNAILMAIGLDKQPFLTSDKQAIFCLIGMTIWQEVGFTMLIFLSGLQSIPNDYYEAAKIDGANGWKLFTNITIPLMKRSILYCVVTTTIFSFTTFTSIYIMTKGGPMNSTRLIVYQIYEQAFKLNNMGYACAMAVFLIILLMIISFIQFRFLDSKSEL